MHGAFRPAQKRGWVKQFVRVPRMVWLLHSAEAAGRNTISAKPGTFKRRVWARCAPVNIGSGLAFERHHGPFPAQPTPSTHVGLPRTSMRVRNTIFKKPGTPTCRVRRRTRRVDQCPQNAGGMPPRVRSAQTTGIAAPPRKRPNAPRPPFHNNVSQRAPRSAVQGCKTVLTNGRGCVVCGAMVLGCL